MGIYIYINSFVWRVCKPKLLQNGPNLGGRRRKPPKQGASVTFSGACADHCFAQSTAYWTVKVRCEALIFRLPCWEVAGIFRKERLGAQDPVAVILL